MLDLEAIKKRWAEQLLQERAWRLEEERDGDVLTNIVIYDHLDHIIIDVDHPVEDDDPWHELTSKEFLALAVQAPTDIRALLAEVERLRAELAMPKAGDETAK